jgi:hypothetical protein
VSGDHTSTILTVRQDPDGEDGGNQGVTGSLPVVSVAVVGTSILVLVGFATEPNVRFFAVCSILSFPVPSLTLYSLLQGAVRAKIEPVRDLFGTDRRRRRFNVIIGVRRSSSLSCKCKEGGGGCKSNVEGMVCQIGGSRKGQTTNSERVFGMQG